MKRPSVVNIVRHEREEVYVRLCSRPLVAVDAEVLLDTKRPGLFPPSVERVEENETAGIAGENRSQTRNRSLLVGNRREGIAVRIAGPRPATLGDDNCLARECLCDFCGLLADVGTSLVCSELVVEECVTVRSAVVAIFAEFWMVGELVEDFDSHDVACEPCGRERGSCSTQSSNHVSNGGQVVVDTLVADGDGVYHVPVRTHLRNQRGKVAGEVVQTCEACENCHVVL